MTTTEAPVEHQNPGTPAQSVLGSASLRAAALRTRSHRDTTCGATAGGRQLIERAVRVGRDGDLRLSLDPIASHQAIVQPTADSAEAMSAFTERRKPHSDEQ